ncbi:hypothetical protein AtNW77_Chr1g0044191 [Arabidopsis thaliana]|uniref:F9C16.22 n=3 Tax=Arabidopsis TaxID=3701 RepID=Q9LNZ6_ARATH|nr:uncharacterized protein AT1G44010 [Arabidopsis thaliana]KAG7648716.1 hypothetical protein ISN45_At01g037950 [Arabidopsis thaliana x Arabidopsis arenosa]AAF79668.1 F9C16.22 [Arabidopsis thaliana]AAX55086.1 hypothetical protein At1g44010 [Arabidopsis thaliana]AEE32012.1 transmembrane protein [Arabidopsis thaliana]OAP14315.1 hypothetical protein AXX17_AT1G40030 [Arabidopsis thaliana]|eukprot:NP_175067.1 transmembrane protein [Arabidopsis thaliana]
MEGPLLTKNKHIKIHGDSSSNDEHNVNITITNDSSSTPHGVNIVERCIPCTREMEWFCFIEFVLNIVQIVAAFVVVTRAKDEHPGTSFLVWIIGYTCGCVAILLIQFINRISSRSYEEIMDVLKNICEYFFVGWVVLFLWMYHSSSSSLYDNTQYFWLCMAFLAFTCIRYVPARLICSAICFIFVVIIWFCADVLGTTPSMFANAVFLIVFIGILKVIEEVIGSYCC